VEQIDKKIVKPFSNGLNVHETAEKQHSWSSGLLAKANYFELKGVYPFHMQMKIKTSFEALPEKIDAIDKL